MRVGRIEGLEGPFWASRLHMSSVLRKWCCGSHQMQVFAFKGTQFCHLPPGPILVRIGPGEGGLRGEKARIGDPVQAKIDAFYEGSGADQPPGEDGEFLRL